MASKKLYRLAFSATSNIQTKPTANTFITTLTPVNNINALTILASKFYDDSGSSVAIGKLKKIVESNGYYMLFWGGVLQHATVYTVSSTKVVFAFDAMITVAVNTPVTLSVINFEPTASITVRG